MHSEGSLGKMESVCPARACGEKIIQDGTQGSLPTATHAAHTRRKRAYASLGSTALKIVERGGRALGKLDQVSSIQSH